MTDNLFPEDTVPRKPLTRDQIFDLDRLYSGHTGPVGHTPDPTITPDGVTTSEPVTARLAGPITLALSQLEAVDILPRHVPNLRIIDTTTGRIVQSGTKKR